MEGEAFLRLVGLLTSRWRQRPWSPCLYPRALSDGDTVRLSLGTLRSAHWACFSVLNLVTPIGHTSHTHEPPHLSATLSSTHRHSPTYTSSDTCSRVFCFDSNMKSHTISDSCSSSIVRSTKAEMVLEEVKKIVAIKMSFKPGKETQWSVPLNYKV